MGFPRYPEYKDSGVAWLGKLPSHWSRTRIKHALSSIGSGGTPDTNNENYWTSSEGVPWVAIGDMSNREEVLETVKQITRDGLESKSLEIWPVGTLLFSMYASLGHVCVLKIPAAFNQAILALLPKHGVDQRFLKKWFEFLRPHLTEYSSSNTQDNLNAEKVRNLHLLMPPPDEQQAIANFLDRETSKIDALVAEQQRLIELLKEKRQAVISHAVTKGLNPNAPMKPSGIPWLGDVPKHWEVVPIKRIVSTPVTDGPHETPEFLDEGVPFVSAEAVSTGKLDFSKIRGHITPEYHEQCSKKYKPEIGDIYMVKSGATTGVTAIVDTDIEFNIWSPLAVIRCGPGMLPNFCLHAMRSRNFLEGVTLSWSFGTQQNIGMGVIENLSLAVPPIDEQENIVKKLDANTGSTDELIQKSEHAIGILQERRTALISAAVTGKIDVRNAVPEPLAS